MMCDKQSNSKKSKYVIILSVCGIASILILLVAGEIHYIDPQYIAFRNYIGSDDSCSFLRSVVQQDTYLEGTNDLRLLKQTYYDQKCGNPDDIPKEHSVIPNANNIQTITRDDLDFMHIPQDHTVVIDCMVFSISPNENMEKFWKMSEQNGCIQSSANDNYVGSWRYFN